jgi:hypothetical protein
MRKLNEDEMSDFGICKKKESEGQRAKETEI